MNQIALIDTEAAADKELLQRYADFLHVWTELFPMASYPVNDRAELIPLSDLPRLHQALAKRLQPATEKQRAGFVALLCSGWPHAHQKTDEGLLEGFLDQLEQDMAEFPGDILHETVRQLRRKQRFFPAISELFAEANRLTEPRRIQISLIDDHQREHERRAAVAKAEAERLAKEAAEEAAFHAKFVTTFGPAATKWTVPDLAAVQKGLWGIGARAVGEWRIAVEDGKTWAQTVVPAAAVLGSALPLYKAGTINTDQVNGLINAANANPDHARRIIDDIEGAASALPHFVSDYREYPQRLLAEIIREARR